MPSAYVGWVGSAVAAVACVACGPARPRGPAPIACAQDLVAETARSVRGVEAWCEDSAGHRAGVYERRLPTGQLVERASYAGDVLDGDYASWYPDGGHHASGRYARGERDGAWHAWHENGKPWLEGAYAAGERTGPWVEYDFTGQKMFEGTYVRGRLEGAWRAYAFGGAERAHGTSVNGVLDGELERVSGSQRYRETWRANRIEGSVTQLDEHGTVVRVLQFHDGVEVKASDAPK